MMRKRNPNDTSARYARYAKRTKAARLAGGWRAAESTKAFASASSSGLIGGESLAVPDVKLEKRRKSPIRVRTFMIGATRGGVTGDPRMAVAYWMRKKLSSVLQPVAPARLIDPTTGAIRGYMDPNTRRVFKDARLTKPLYDSGQTASD
jgi:hypothetical protein